MQQLKIELGIAQKYFLLRGLSGRIMELSQMVASRPVPDCRTCKRQVLARIPLVPPLQLKYNCVTPGCPASGIPRKTPALALGA